MAASQLGIYNRALAYLGQRKLASLQENREPLRYMNDEYAKNNEFCLSEGNWVWSMKLVELQASTTVVPNFGYAFAFPKPADVNHTYQVSDNEVFDPLLRYFTDMNNIWYADITPIYVAYVSNETNYGLNLAMWSDPFFEFVACRLAWLCAPRILQDRGKVAAIAKDLKLAKAVAVNKDSQNTPPGKIPFGTWVMGRAPRGSITPLATPYAGQVS